jgi:hypothetical protein
MTGFFGGIFDNDNPGHGGSWESRGDSARPLQCFARIDRLLAALGEPGLVALNTIQLDVEAGKFPDVLAAFFADEHWDYQDRWMIGGICKDDRADTYRHGRFTFEARSGLTERLLVVGDGVRWGAPLLLGRVVVHDSDVATAIRQSPFEAPGRELEAVSRSAWAATKDLDGLAVWVRPGQPDIVRRIGEVLETA